MPERMKDQYYNADSLHQFALRVNAVSPLFQPDDFVREIMDETWAELGLKACMRKITIQLGKYLPTAYEQALRVLDQVAAGYPAGYHDNALLYFPDFVEVFGQDVRHWDISIAALERYTALSTSEFAVRPFLLNHAERMMAQMLAWTDHENEHVRRLASEGCRPALPWAQALPDFKKDPSPVLEVLARLKADPSAYVRKSVANNLNDISKTHPSLIAQIVKDWYGKCDHTDWIVKHGCRTLLKNGSSDVLGIFGFGDADCVRIRGFALHAASVRSGGTLTFSFEVASEASSKVRLEYGIDYVKANGRRTRKIFQISEPYFKHGTKKTYQKNHSFADVSSRKHYPGVHSITLIVNGVARDTLDFEVLF